MNLENLFVLKTVVSSEISRLKFFKSKTNRSFVRGLFSLLVLTAVTVAFTGCGGGGGGGGDDEEIQPVNPDEENRWDFMNWDEGVWG